MGHQHRGESRLILEQLLERIRRDRPEGLIRRRQQGPGPRVPAAELRADAGGLDGGPQRGEAFVLGDDLLDAAQFRQHHGVDHMHQSAVEGHIRRHQAGTIDRQRRWIDVKRLSRQRREPAPFEDRRTADRLADHVVLEDRLQRGLALGAGQELDLVLGQFREGLVRRCEDGELRACRELDSRSLDERKQRGEVCLGGHGCQGVRRGGGGRLARRPDPVDFDRERAFLLVSERDAHRFDGGRVKRRRIAHALAEAVGDALAEGDLDLGPLASLGGEDALVAAGHQAKTRGSDVTLVVPAVALDAQHQSARAVEGALWHRRANLREAAVVLKRELAGEAQRAAITGLDAAGGQPAHHAVQHGLPALRAALELEVRVSARCDRGAGEQGRKEERRRGAQAVHGQTASRGAEPWMPNPD